MRRRVIYILVLAVLFPVLEKAGIECSQHGYAISGSWLVSLANTLKVVFPVLLIALLVAATRTYRNPFARFAIAALFVPLFLVFCMVIAMSGWIILNTSRPAWPGTFIKDPSAVSQLTDLANEMIQRRRITWVGNSRWRFIFDINDGDVEYQFASTFISKDHDFSKPVDAEDTSKVHHFDSPFLSNALEPTDKVLLDPNDYAFCKRASEIIRRTGFDNVQLYPEQNVVQYQIHDFIGWDGGTRCTYYFCPTGTLPEDFTYTQQLTANWYYAQKPRFSER